jgi:hypothetical protein
MPGNSSGTGTNLYYSWNYGLAHFIAVDTETELDTPGITE